MLKPLARYPFVLIPKLTVGVKPSMHGAGEFEYLYYKVQLISKEYHQI